MLFNSFGFLFLFLPIVSLTYYICAKRFSSTVTQTVLVAASLVFYSFSNPKYTPLLVASIVLNYAFGRVIHTAVMPWRKRWLVLALSLNIGLLAIFKYLSFILSNFSFLGKPIFTLPDWSFPLGVSFYTLQQIMYLVDCYEGLIEANGFLTHATFVSFFPYIISGPITRARQIIPQILQTSPVEPEKVSQALVLLAIGLFKKVVIADSFSRIADAGFSMSFPLSTLEAWASSFAFTFQIYFDFSGYTDIALGVALLLGLRLPSNFNAPYRSHSVTEFWQRWHITLSQFITIYLYTPIVRAFKRVTLAKASLATLLAMAIAGLWHGPSWNFAIFGALHGAALTINQIWRRKIKWGIPKVFSWAATFLFANFAFIFFRAPHLADALHICRASLPVGNLLGTSNFRGALGSGDAVTLALPLIIGTLSAFMGKTSVDLSENFRPTLANMAAISLLMFIALIFMNSTVAKDFIYFKF